MVLRKKSVYSTTKNLFHTDIFSLSNRLKRESNLQQVTAVVVSPGGTEDCFAGESKTRLQRYSKINSENKNRMLTY
ncbi:MAG TPA: hypothetical protein VJY62_04725 [Bacteroidia bacterium]|nr:hypothetical protein [Bacteroidia bacterium]